VVYEIAISVSNLTKKYDEQVAVSDATFEVPLGTICGFVGPNGSGKTTTIRMLLGLIKPTFGSATVLGHSINNPEKYLAQVGAMIEGPAFYPALSGEENLHVLATQGGFPGSRVMELIDTVGLTGRGNSKFKNYSLGMKQRLGIAAALLPDPKLLILDEPTNGLDPAGIHEIRTLLRELAENGTTVFVSSHLLSELEMISEYLVMLREGKVIFSGLISDLLEAQQSQILVKPEFEVDSDRLMEEIQSAGHTVEIKDGVLHVLVPENLSSEINRLAFAAGITLQSLTQVLPTLEETFFDMTGGQA